MEGSAQVQLEADEDAKAGRTVPHEGEGLGYFRRQGKLSVFNCQ